MNSARVDGGALLVTGEPGVGKTALLRAAADAVSADTRVIRAAGAEFEAETSFTGLNQVLLPLLGSLPQLDEVHRDALNVALGFAEGAPPSPTRRVERGARTASSNSNAATGAGHPRRPAVARPSERRSF